MKSHNRTAQAKDIAVNSLYVFALVSIVGMISNVLLLAVGYIVSIPLAESGITDEKVQALWFFLAVFSLLASAALVFFMTWAVGGAAATFRIGYHLERKLDVPAMITSVLIGNALHVVFCIAFSWVSLAYLIFAGPVQYIARFIGKGEYSLFNDIALDFSHEIVIGSIMIYAVIITAATFAGYIVGHKRKLSAADRKEAEDARSSVRPENVWSAKDAEKEARPDEYIREEKVKVVREKLDPKTEAKFRQINKSRMIITAVFLVLWTAAVIIFAAYWIPHTGRELFSPYTAPFPILLILPYWPFRLHERFTRRSCYAVITMVKTETRSTIRKTTTGGYRGMGSETVGVLLLRTERGESIKLNIPLDILKRYEKGEHVFLLSAYKYPVKCSYDYDDDVFCPKCGHSVEPGPERCPRCRTKFARTR